MKKAILLVLLLSGCEFLEAHNHSQKVEPYKVTSRKTAPGQYELDMNGEPGVEVEILKTAFKTKGTELCNDKVYLLRGMREESDPAQKRHDLHGIVDCVDLDYFK